MPKLRLSKVFKMSPKSCKSLSNFCNKKQLETTAQINGKLCRLCNYNRKINKVMKLKMLVQMEFHSSRYPKQATQTKQQISNNKDQNLN